MSFFLTQILAFFHEDIIDQDILVLLIDDYEFECCFLSGGGVSRLFFGAHDLAQARDLGIGKYGNDDLQLNKLALGKRRDACKLYS